MKLCVTSILYGFNMNNIEQLQNILKLLKMRPASGFGLTKLEWRDGEIFAIVKEESFRAKDIN